MAFDTNNKPYGKSPHIWRFDSNNDNQLFQIIKNKDDTYCIKKRDSNYYIGMENKDGEWIISSRNKGENFQKFKFIHIENDYFLIQNEKGKFIDFVGEDKDGGIIKPNDKKDSLGQQWKLFIK